MNMDHIEFKPISAKKYVLKEFLDLIDTVPDSDEAEAVSRLITYMNGLLRVKEVVPPVSEIMTVIKHQKPALYHATRRSITSSSPLNLLFQIDMSLDLALERLQAFGQETDPNNQGDG